MDGCLESADEPSAKRRVGAAAHLAAPAALRGRPPRMAASRARQTHNWYNRVAARARRENRNVELFSHAEVLAMTRLGSACSVFFLLCLALLFVDTAVAQDTAAQRQYNAAVGLHNSGAYDLAAAEWKKFVEAHPEHENASKAWHYLGICQSKLNQLDQAIATYQTVVTKYPDCPLLEDTYLNLGLTQYNLAIGGQAAQYDAAAKTFETLVTKYPEGKYLIDATFYWGESLYNRGKKKDSLAKYQATVEKAQPQHPLYPQALFALGVNCTDLGQHQEAVTHYDAYLEKFPQSDLVPEVHMWRGESRYELKKYADAVTDFTAASAAAGFANADYAGVRQADALAAERKYAEAAAVYESVPARFPKSQYVGLCNLEAGKKYYAANQWDKALENLNKVVAAGGKSAPEAAHWAARCLLNKNQPAEALKTVEGVLSGAPEGANKRSLLVDQADALYEIPQRRRESVAKYAAYAEAYPDDASAPQAIYMAAFASMNLADYAKALGYADQFLAAHANHELAVGVKHVQAESSLLTGKYAEAGTLYDELLTQAPKDADAEIWKVHRGTALYLARKYQEAIDALTAVIEELKTPDLLAEAQYRIGRSQTALKKYPAAVESLEVALTAAPKWKLADDTLLVLAYCHQQMNQRDKAAEAAQRVIDEFPNSKRLDAAHYRLAECARLGNQLKKAVTEYQAVLDNWPDGSLTKQSYYGLGWAHLGARDYAAADKAFTSLIDKYPDDELAARTRYGRGMARRQLKQFGPATEDLEAYLATGPKGLDMARALHILGLCQKGLGKHQEAVATFQKLLADQSSYPDADRVYFEMGWSLKELKKADDSLKAFETLVTDHADSDLVADAQYLIGDYHYDKKDYKKAAVGYYAAMQKAGKSALGEEASYKLGLCYYLRDDFPNAQATFAYQVATWPKGSLASDGRFMQGESYFRQENWEKALESYQKVAKPTNPDVVALKLLHASHCALQTEQFDEALALADQLIADHAKSEHVPKAMYQKGRALHKLDRKDEALEIYNAVLEKTTDESAAASQFMIGEIEFEGGRHEDAVKSFYKLMYNYAYPKWQADATYEAARCFEVLKKIPQAKKLYAELVKKYPNSDKVSLAEARLKKL